MVNKVESLEVPCHRDFLSILSRSEQPSDDKTRTPTPLLAKNVTLGRTVPSLLWYTALSKPDGQLMLQMWEETPSRQKLLQW